MVVASERSDIMASIRFTLTRDSDGRVLSEEIGVPDADLPDVITALAMRYALPVDTSGTEVFQHWVQGAVGEVTQLVKTNRLHRDRALVPERPVVFTIKG
jgi:hypothetical protein